MTTPLSPATWFPARWVGAEAAATAIELVLAGSVRDETGGSPTTEDFGRSSELPGLGLVLPPALAHPKPAAAAASAPQGPELSWSPKVKGLDWERSMESVDILDPLGEALDWVSSETAVVLVATLSWKPGGSASSVTEGIAASMHGPRASPE